MIKIIEHLPPFFEEIIDELTGQQQGAQARHNWQSEIYVLNTDGTNPQNRE